ncbi:methionine--tRNA ligase [Nocardia stercoris]|uniref:Methionine--tRNA ligase n=1 Tax=Nocardia stercoris TaxID=2483361 RepID=A0A3M2L9T5_9NOCA|nr:methionine--tRNA ligase [Nocardia stercoris]RMI32685.1 methionine--tRNA ligase [Nocardia stercoris]
MTRHLITSALPYINGVKHLGNLVGSMLPADVYARYLRARGHEVLFVCATDEHGTPAELAAAAAGLTVAEFCAQAHATQKAIYDGFGLSFDVFGRTSSHQNIEITQHFARKLFENGFVEERPVRQVYSATDGRFLPDRYVTGTCPHCGYERARGDQCENCTRLLDPTDLVNPRSAISGSTDLEVRETSHLFLLQSKLQPEVEDWIDRVSGQWPHLATSIARKWLAEGLRDRAITRDLDWGVPVPADTWPDLAAAGKVFYVWFDAPIGYLAATKEWSDADPARPDWKSWWYDTTDVRYTEFMGKDNVPFHTVMFPATELGVREPWKMVDYIKSFSWLNYYGGKFSTSEHRGIFTDDALELLPADYWRYFMIANAPESDDVSFSWELFASQTNKDLADVLGNFVNRVLTFCAKRFGEQLPAGSAPGAAEHELGKRLSQLLADYERHLDEIELRKATATLRTMWSLANEYINDKAPWTQIKTEPDAAALTLRTAANLIFLFGVISEPVIPTTAATLRSLWHEQEPHIAGLGWPEGHDVEALSWLQPGTGFTVPPVLFAKITDDEVSSWRSRFGADDRQVQL